MVQQAFVKKNTYQDSVKLMLITERIRKLPGVAKVMAIMGTDNNKATSARSGFDQALMVDAGPNDILFVVEAQTEAAAKQAWDEFQNALEQQTQAEQQTVVAATSLKGAVRELSQANLAVISVPGAYAAYEAFQALREGLHVQIFSDNVALEDEIRLKKLGRELGLLVMGPDCGTSIISGVPICFANVVKPGRIGIVGASGTGIQQVACIIDNLGEGVSHAIGVGGRDLSDEVDGITTKMALDLLNEDPATEVIVLISKPPGPAATRSILQRMKELPKPVVVLFMGQDASALTDCANAASTLEEAALLAISLCRGERPGSLNPYPRELPAELRARLATATPVTRKYLRGLYSGGTLASEALYLLGKQGISAQFNPVQCSQHAIIDLGDDRFTQGRPHPMIDPSLRAQYLLEQWADPQVGIILLDVVLGYGAGNSPAEPLAEAIEQARAQHGDCVTVIGSICGTEKDPQDLRRQAELLRSAGVILFPTNASAVDAAVQFMQMRSERSAG